MIEVHDVLKHAKGFNGGTVGIEGNGFHVGIHGSLIVAAAAVFVAQQVVFFRSHVGCRCMDGGALFQFEVRNLASLYAVDSVTIRAR